MSHPHFPQSYSLFGDIETLSLTFIKSSLLPSFSGYGSFLLTWQLNLMGQLYLLNFSAPSSTLASSDQQQYHNGLWQSLLNYHLRIQMGDNRGSAPLSRKITKLYGSLAILVHIPSKITKLPTQHSMLSHHRPAGLAGGGMMMARFKWYLDPLSPHQLKQQKKEKS